MIEEVFKRKISIKRKLIFVNPWSENGEYLTG